MVESSVEARKTQIRVQKKQPAVVIEHRESDEQRDNLFHSRCLINGKVASLVIDGGSCANSISEYAVRKLELKTQKHPKPYHLTWLNEHGDVKVNKQAEIEFSIGKYSDFVLCDVVPMQNVHILLGRPWQFDRRVLHDGWENSYTFKHEGMKIKLKPLSPDQVFDDLKQMEENRNERKSVQAQLWVQRSVGFNFMSLRKLARGVTESKPHGFNDPCFVAARQSFELPNLVKEEGSELRSETTPDAFLEVKGTSRSQEEALDRAGDDRFPPSTTLPPLCHFPEEQSVAEQSANDDDLVMVTGADSSESAATKMSQQCPGINSTDWLKPNQVSFPKPIRVPTPMETLKNKAKTTEWVGEIGYDSTPQAASESTHTVPGSCRIAQLSAKTPGLQNPNLQISNRNLKKHDQKIGELVVEFEGYSEPTTTRRVC
ncbi:unnamed protein product [Linum trigynum]|uniref:Polyprotein n=1 Tax=Linum trigynum TaxID=586398 RepID=A0AAV2DY31_9ROSI